MSFTRRTRLAGAGVAFVLALSGGALAAPAAGAAPPAGRLTDLVNPFIGSQNEGNTFPGATVPFGMVQLSPDTGHSTGYDYRQHKIRGFSLVHASGAGCRLGGDLPTLPTTGEVTQTDDAAYAAPFRHDHEQAGPGYYRVRLDSGGGIEAELTATTRTGRQRYTFPATDKANVLLNAGQALHRTVSSTVQVLDDHTVRTAVTGRGFCRDTRPYTVYTITRFNRPFAAFGTWQGKQVTAGAKGSATAVAGSHGAYVRFDARRDRTVEATTALSYVDAAGAAGNLRAEGGPSFDAVRRAADRAWNDRLSRVAVRGGSTDRRRTFYSALYRALLHPNVGQDADGRYRGWDLAPHRARGFRYYQNWSLWDTYRTQAQLLALLAPSESRDMALSVLQVAKDGGWLPKWGYGTVETNIMTGDPVTPFLTNAYQQGLLKGHEEEAYAALKRNADGVPPAANAARGREANVEYLRHGFVPYLKGRKNAGKLGDPEFDESASVTLEYALADAMLAEMARDLGHRADSARYAARARNYRNVFDRSTGFFRARDAQGRFTGPADPARSVGFEEGTAWQYQWLVPQDVPGMLDLLGGPAAAGRRLDSFFAYDAMMKDPAGTARKVWVNGPYAYDNADKYNPQNEPDLIAPYTYLSTGQPWKTTDVVRTALSLFTDAPTGLTGNDDLGTMSSWMVLSSLGVFPVQPGTDTWALTAPVFDRVDLSLDRRYYPRGHLTISASGAEGPRRYVGSVRLDGARRTATYLRTEDLRAHGDLAFTLSGSPTGWGTDPRTAPPTVGLPTTAAEAGSQ
ncbi:GH92 family glycosyl hydrolase [Streptomyces sp. NPDC059740]|uniref:GH92 family glycosyl hydrolase n=1 Tax=Streptomyces sp. NPDC059740 TaxID=3346926 RepID=UPI00365DF997